jgi:hypothetical protein
MNKPYVATEDSDSGLYVSMVTDCSIMPDDLAYGCNNCLNGMSFADDDYDTNSAIISEWQDLGDSGALCPACADR